VFRLPNFLLSIYFLSSFCLPSKKEAIMGMGEALTPFLMKLFTPRVGHCLGKAAFQSTRVARTQDSYTLPLSAVVSCGNAELRDP